MVKKKKAKKAKGKVYRINKNTSHREFQAARANLVMFLTKRL